VGDRDRDVNSTQSMTRIRKDDFKFAGSKSAFRIVIALARRRTEIAEDADHVLYVPPRRKSYP